MLSYILQPSKTPSHVTGGVRVDMQNPAQSMVDVAQIYKKDYGVRLRHFVVAFKPQYASNPIVLGMVAQKICNYIGLKYTVFDEIHFLYSDALFNSMCWQLLRKLPTVFNRCIRIYMSATSWEIKDALFSSEKEHRHTEKTIGLTDMECNIAILSRQPDKTPHLSRTFYHYHKDADYSHYRLHFFEDSQYVPSIGKKTKAELTMRKPYLLTLLSLIENSHPNKDNKWVIFVDKISSGKALLEVITDNGISAAYFDAKTKKPPKAWKKVLTDETFDESVLIATPVIDCGINLQDPAIKNIAILCTERTTFMQLIGRKRLAPDEIIHLWVWAPPSTYFKNMSKRIVSHLELAEDLNDARKHWPSHSYKYADDVRRLWEWNSTHKIRYPSLFYVDNSGFFQASEYVYKILIKRLEFLHQFTNDVNQIDFRTVVKQWLGLPEAQESLETNQIAANTTASVSRLKLSAMLEASTACSLSEEDFKPIRKAIITEALTHRIEKIRSDRMDKLSAKPLNRFLSALMLPYTIKKKANMWTIENKPQ